MEGTVLPRLDVLDYLGVLVPLRVEVRAGIGNDLRPRCSWEGQGNVMVVIPTAKYLIVAKPGEQAAGTGLSFTNQIDDPQPRVSVLALMRVLVCKRRAFCRNRKLLETQMREGLESYEAGDSPSMIKLELVP